MGARFFCSGHPRTLKRVEDPGETEHIQMSELGILPNPIPFGKYYLLERVNIGGMAEIFKAKAFGVEGFERLLAVKKILASIAEDESFINMFIDEAKIAGQLNHPNIAQIFDLGKVNDSYFIALEYISGKDMKTIFERSRRIGEKVSIPRVCYVIMKVCEGLGHAHHKKDANGHDLNIVHRDVSPQNVLISYEGECKIIDFGIAKAQGKTSQTQVGILKGKFSYMSPEQVRGLHIDRRSDIFSLGIVLYEMLTLERLFLGESDFDTLEKIRKVEMSPPSLYNPHIPKELEDIVLKALAKSPEDRYQTSYELADALEQFMRNQGYYYTNKDLAAYMKESFNADIEFEAKKLEYYRSLNLRPPTDEHPATPAPSKLPPMAGLSWGDDEKDTQIFDRSSGVDESIIESIIDADIIYAEELGQVAGHGVSGDSAPDADDPPTVEYNREDIQKSLEEFSFNDDAPGSRQPVRKHLPTAQMPAIEPRREHNTMPGVSAPIAPTGGRQGSSPAVILGVMTLVVVAGAALVYLLWPWPAEVNFDTTPADVRITVDGKQIFDGETPHMYKIKPGMHTIEISRDGFDSVKIEQEFQKSTTYNLKKTLKSLEGEKPLFLVKTTPEDAIVELEGKTFTNPSPKKIKDFAEGKYKVKVYKTGYKPVTEEIEIKKDGSAEFDAKLEPIKFALKLTGEPEKTEVELFDQSTNKSVFKGKLGDTVKDLEGHKSYKLVATRRGYNDYEEVLTPSDETERTVKAALEKEEKTTVASNNNSVGSKVDPPKKDPPKKDPIVKKDPPKKDPPKKDPPKKDPPKGTAELTIASRPAARVYIDGKDTGHYTPLIKYKVPATKHKIELKNTEFNLSKTYYVDLKPGESKKIINK